MPAQSCDKFYLEESRWKDNEDEEQKLSEEEWLAPLPKLLGISNIFKQLLHTGRNVWQLACMPAT